MNLCLCGCGTAVKNKYVLGHQLIGKPSHNRRKITVFHFCECGCGTESKNKFVKGHRISWNKGRKSLQTPWNKGLTKETDQRLIRKSPTEAQKSKWTNFCLCGCGEKCARLFVNGHQFRSAEVVDKIRQKHIGLKASQKTKDLMSLQKKGKRQSEIQIQRRVKSRREHWNAIPKELRPRQSKESNEKRRQTLLGRKQSPEAIEKSRLRRTGQKRAPEVGEKIRQKALGRPVKESTKEIMRVRTLGKKRSEATKQKHRDADLTKWIAAGTKAIRDRSKPTKIEKITENFFVANNIQYESQIIIGNYIVDFILPQSMTIVEIDGCYWHKCKECGYDNEPFLEKQEKRDSLLKKQGYTVLHLKEHDLQNELMRLL